MLINKAGHLMYRNRLARNGRTRLQCPRPAAFFLPPRSLMEYAPLNELLLRYGTRNPEGGPFGVVINRPLHKKIKHMKPTNHELATTFAECPLHFGGPLEASVFLSRTGNFSKLPGTEEVIPGLCFGARNSLDEAAELVKRGALKSRDFKFFVGYAGWQVDELREKIESDYWHVASCSPNMILGDSWSVSLWEDILQEMGGHYSELSRKSKQDI